MRSQTYSQEQSRRSKDKANVFLRKRKYNKALEAYTKAYEQNPSDLWVLHKIADCHFAMGKIEPAVRVLETLADHYERNGRFKKAIAVLKRAHDIYPSGDTLIAMDRLRDLMNTPIVMGEIIGPRSPEMPLYGLEIDFDL